MCTLTWTHRAAGWTGWTDRQGPKRGASGAPPDGYRLWFNRDELRTRGPEVPPRIESPAGGVRYIAPADSDAGGTWLAVNELGITVALLNGYRDSRGPERARWTSRGHLVRELASMGGVRHAWRRLTPTRLREFRPLVVAVVAPDRPALLVRWDGLDVTFDARGHRQLPVVSSSYAQSEVQVRRRALYEGLVDAEADHGRGGARCPGAPRPETLEAFHRSTPEGGPDAYSPSMARPEAATRSQCRVEVAGDEVLLHYAPGPPHETAHEPPVRLPRRR
ncbi:MAG: NRDE family protein [Planctomycetota bacterium]